MHSSWMTISVLERNSTESSFLFYLVALKKIFATRSFNSAAASLRATNDSHRKILLKSRRFVAILPSGHRIGQNYRNSQARVVA